MVCYQQPGHARAGLTDAYCGPKIIHENANQLVAIEDRAFDIVRAIYFDKRKYTLMMTELDELNNTEDQKRDRRSDERLGLRGAVGREQDQDGTEP